jgi:hypothetical protein
MTIGLIDALISISNVLAPRLDAIDDLMRLGEIGDKFQPIRNALSDLCTSSNLRKIVDAGDGRAMAIIHEAAALVQNAAPKPHPAKTRTPSHTPD